MLKSLITIVNQQEKRKTKQPNTVRLHFKFFWLVGHIYWSDEEFKEQMRINRETSDFILEQISHLIHKEPTYMVANPIEDHRQLNLTIYRMALGSSFKFIMDMFGVSQSFATEAFNNVINYVVLTLYDHFFAYQEQNGQTNIKVS